MSHGEAPVVYLPCGTKQFLNWARLVFNRCQWCNGKFSDHNQRYNPSHDHFIPRSRGGKNHIENIVLSCRDCNNKKGNKRSYSRFPFYGPRWKSIDQSIFIKLERCKSEGCNLWFQEKGKKWKLLFEGTWEECYKFRKNHKKKFMGIRTLYYTASKGLKIRDELHETLDINQHIAERAYYKWINSGCIHGFDEHFWLEAEKEVLEENE